MELPKFLKIWNLFYLPGSNSEVVPGSVLSKEFLKRHFQHCGHVSHFISGPVQSFWESELTPHPISFAPIYLTLETDKEGKAEGPSFKFGGLRPGVRMTVCFESIRGRAFRSGAGRASKFSIITLSNALRSTNSASWNKMRRCWIVAETYQASQLAVTISSRLVQNPRSAVEEAGGISLFGNGQYEWQSSRTFQIREHQTPFAFCGFKVA